MAAATSSVVVSGTPRAEFDLIPTIAQYLDPHLVLPVLDSDFYKGLQVYDAKALLDAKLSLSRRTKMMDYSITIYQELHGADAEIPAELSLARDAVQDEWQRRIDACGPLTALVGMNEPSPQLEELERNGHFTLAHLQETHGVTAEHVEALYACAKFRYDCGEYDVAADYLEYYRHLMPPEHGKSLAALWGKFGAEILNQLWDAADRDREILRGAIGKAALTDLQSLHQRTWLLHWSLFIFANDGKGRENLLEFFLLDTHLSTISLACPWLLRYVIAVLLTQRKKQYSHMKSVLRLLAADSSIAALNDPVRGGGRRRRRRRRRRRQSAYCRPRSRTGERMRALTRPCAHSAPSPHPCPPPAPSTAPAQIVAFTKCLYVQFDFEAAQARLADCASVVATDFFLSHMMTVEEFLASARTAVFEVYCKVHQTIDLHTLAPQLGLSLDDAERWVVDLIRTAQLDAKVDSKTATVQMLQPAHSV